MEALAEPKLLPDFCLSGGGSLLGLPQCLATASAARIFVRVVLLPVNRRQIPPEVVFEWTYRLAGVSLERQEAAQERLAGWNLPHAASELAPVSADGSLGAVLLVESVDLLTARGIDERRLIAKIRRDPDVWPAWAEIRAAGLLARFAPDDAQLLLEADRAAGRHADFTFAFSGDEPRHSIEFKAVGLSDPEVEFSERVAPMLPGLLPRRGINTMHVEDTDFEFRVPREVRRHHRREAERLADNVFPTVRGIAAAVIVGHGTEEAYTRRLANRFREALDQLPAGDACWVAFHWSNGAPIEMVQRALAATDFPDYVAGVTLMGSVAIPGRLNDYLMWFLAPFSDEGESQWHSDANLAEAQQLFEIVNRCGGLRLSYVRVPWQGAMHDFLHRAGRRRILPFNLVMAPDPPELVPPRGRRA